MLKLNRMNKHKNGGISKSILPLKQKVNKSFNHLELFKILIKSLFYRGQ